MHRKIILLIFLFTILFPIMGAIDPEQSTSFDLKFEKKGISSFSLYDEDGNNALSFLSLGWAESEKSVIEKKFKVKWTIYDGTLRNHCKISIAIADSIESLTSDGFALSSQAVGAEELGLNYSVSITDDSSTGISIDIANVDKAISADMRTLEFSVDKESISGERTLQITLNPPENGYMTNTDKEYTGYIVATLISE